MTNVLARLKTKGKNFEVLVDLDKALEFKKNGGDISQVLLSDEVVSDVKKGLRVPDEDLEECFGTLDLNTIAEKIIKQGEVQLPAEYKNKERGEKVKQVIDFLTKNAVDPQTDKPHTSSRIEQSLQQAGINVENKPIDQQIKKIVEKLQEILPIKIETKKLSIKIPAQHTGKAYGLINEYKEKEEWLDNGDLSILVKIPSGLQMEFYDKLNSITHGSAIVEEKKNE